MPIADNKPLGVIFNTNSRGRFDLLVYDDGLLAIRGTYVGVALRGGGAGMAGVVGGGAGAGGGLTGAAAAGAGTAAGWSGATSYEGKRIAKILQRSRVELIEANQVNFFIPRASVSGVVLRKHWYGCSLTVRTDADPAGRRFTWKPALNNFAHVRELTLAAFDDLLHVE
jgi:hypothetical protein